MIRACGLLFMRRANNLWHRTLILSLIIVCSPLMARQTAVYPSQDLPALLSRFTSEQDWSMKEEILNTITRRYPDAGKSLLKIARETKDTDTEWFAIRGIGSLKFKGASSFLRRSLFSESVFVRANSARALGEIHDTSAEGDLIRLLRGENDNGVIEQTSLALQMLGARQALPVLKAKAPQSVSAQTRGWIIGATEALGLKADVPFFASFLSDPNDKVAEAAAHAIEHFCGHDFGLPKVVGGLGGVPREAIKNAQSWWNTHQTGCK